jgi:Tol biopolymer transport system component
MPESWSPNGETLLLNAITKDSRASLRALSLRDRKEERFGSTESMETMDAVFSPNGRWVAYDSREGAGQARVYVEPFPRTGAQYLITKDEGRSPFWSPNGKELFYAVGGGGTQFFVVTIATEAGFAFGNPTSVPRGGLTGGGGPGSRRNYDLSPDGKRIFGILDGTQAQPGTLAGPVIQVVLNWLEELKQRVPVD